MVPAANTLLDILINFYGLDKQYANALLARFILENGEYFLANKEKLEDMIDFYW